MSASSLFSEDDDADWAGYLHGGAALKWTLVALYVVVALLGAVACQLLHRHRRLTLWSAVCAMGLAAVRAVSLAVPDAVYATPAAARAVDAVCEALCVGAFSVLLALCAQSSARAILGSHARTRHSLTYSLIAEDSSAAAAPQELQQPSQQEPSQQQQQQQKPQKKKQTPLQFRVRSVLALCCTVVPLLVYISSLVALFAGNDGSCSRSWAGVSSLVRGAAWVCLQLAFAASFAAQFRKLIPRIRAGHALQPAQLRALALVGDLTLLPVFKALFSPLDWLSFCASKSPVAPPYTLQRATWALYLFASEVLPMLALLGILGARAVSSSNRRRSTLLTRQSSLDFQLFTTRA